MNRADIGPEAQAALDLLAYQPPADPDKAFQTLAARCALAGATLLQVPAHGFEPEAYVVGWHGLSRSFPSLAAVDTWLVRFEGG